MKELTSPSGLRYKLWDDVKDAPLLIYLSGKDENINSSIFVNQFVPANKDKFIIAAPYFIAGKSGWEWMLQNNFAGVTFTKEMKTLNPGDGRTFITGFSAGGTYDVYARLATDITAFCSCAGSGDDYHSVVEFATKGVPGKHYHGDADGAPYYTSPNNYKLGKKTAIDWFRAAGGNIEFITIPGGGHSSAPQRAYSTTENLAAWFLSKGNPTNPVLKDPVKNSYFVESEGKLIVETESGKVLKFTPE
jgi:hypothetical protein